MAPYRVDGNDAVVQLLDVPVIETGAPHPCVLATEQLLELRYFIGQSPDRDRIARIRFQSSIAHFFGPPNDETLHGHPLYGRGLEWYAGFEVIDSSWLRSLEADNRVHDRHNPEQYRAYRHFIFAFHDSTFECIAKGYQVEVVDAET